MLEETKVEKVVCRGDGIGSLTRIIEVDIPLNTVAAVEVKPIEPAMVVARIRDRVGTLVK